MSRRAGLARLLCALALLRGASAAEPTPDEYQVKAVFLFNFGQFVEWPAEAFATPQSPFVICVVGDDPFGRTLDDVVRGEVIGSRVPVVRRLRDANGVSACHIAFIGRGEREVLPQALAAARGHGVLTVSDIDGAEHQGAMIVLYQDQNRIRMRINLGATRASQLVVSSKLLRPAEVIGAETGR